MNNIIVKSAATVLVLLCVSWWAADTACAHRVNVFAWVDGDIIHGKSKFSGGKGLKSGKITVLNAQGITLYRGLTNHQGEFSFKIPQPTDLRIIVSAGQGHQGEWTVRADEMNGGDISPPSRATTTITNQSPTGKSARPASEDTKMPALRPELNREELEAIVESAVDRKLKPIREILGNMQDERPGLKDILAGVGYIFGIVGFVAYLNSRKKKA